MQTSTNGLNNKKIFGSSHGNNRKYFNHYEQMQKMLDTYNTKHASVEFRRNAIRNQKKNNYQLEYDRIRSILGQNLIPYTTKAMIKERMNELQKLGARAVNKLQD